MARTQPKLSDLAPRLRALVGDLAIAHDRAFPERALCLIWAHRSVNEQRAAHRAGRSKIDPDAGRYSLHNYKPALAADLWVYLEPSGSSATFFEGRPPKALGLALKLLNRGDLRAYYMPLGRLAELVGLEAGALWRTFRDGPHVQLTKTDRIKALQEALAAKGFSAGAIDGDCGPKTKAAIKAAAKAAGISGRVSWRQSRLMPISPALWEWLHDQGAERGELA